jgi:hypothetical protein
MSGKTKNDASNAMRRALVDTPSNGITPVIPENIYKRIELVQMSGVNEKTEWSEGNCLCKISRRDHASNPT